MYKQILMVMGDIQMSKKEMFVSISLSISTSTVGQQHYATLHVCACA